MTKTQIDFTYDKDLRLTNITRSNKVNTTLTWDNANRLVGLKDGDVSNLLYTLDDAGQVTQTQWKVAARSIAQSPTSNVQTSNTTTLHRSQRLVIAYDAQGRLTASPANKFAWDANSQLVGIDSVKLSYNGLGEVISRDEGGKVTRFRLQLRPRSRAHCRRDPQDAKPTRYYVWTPQSGALLYTIDAADANKV